MKKTKNRVTVIAFILLVFGLCAADLLTPDMELSYSERRRLTQAPDLTLDTVFSGQYMKELDRYLLDQFPMRDNFRTLKALIRFRAFRQKDNNLLYSVDDGLFKLEYPLKNNEVLYGADKFNAVYETYLKGMNVYYAIIPDKNYFVAKQHGYPSLDYNAMLSLMTDTVKNMHYIDIFDHLTLEDFYRTDTHWRQERIYPAALRIAESMGADIGFTPYSGYEQHVLSPFYGVYHGQMALPVKPEELVYLTNPIIENAVVHSLGVDGELSVYELSEFTGMDSYNVFLSGAQAIVTIECGGVAERELVIFRDSFGSSIAPFFAGAYSKITLIDLRYIPSDYLSQYITFETQDVLFLYSTSLLNNGMLLK